MGGKTPADPGLRSEGHIHRIGIKRRCPNLQWIQDRCQGKMSAAWASMLAWTCDVVQGKHHRCVIGRGFSRATFPPRTRFAECHVTQNATKTPCCPFSVLRVRSDGGLRGGHVFPVPRLANRSDGNDHHHDGDDNDDNEHRRDRAHRLLRERCERRRCRQGAFRAAAPPAQWRHV